MRLKKKLLRAVSCTVATAAVTAMLLTGCGGGGSAPAASSPSNEPPASSTTKPDNSSSSSSSSSSSESPSSSSIEEPEKPTDGIEWKYTDNKNGTATLTGYNKSGQKVPSGQVTIPRKVGENHLTVTDIGYQAFYQDNNITGIIIPDTVKTIGERAFCKCENLTNVVLPKSLKQ